MATQGIKMRYQFVQVKAQVNQKCKNPNIIMTQTIKII